MTRQLKQADAEIYTELAGTKCSCGRRKGAGKSFCWQCWCKLRSAMKRALYDERGYCESVRQAKQFLREREAPSARRRCKWCSAWSTKLCDGPRAHNPAIVSHQRKTCDAPMCDEHAKSIGPDRDLCPDCVKALAPSPVPEQGRLL